MSPALQPGSLLFIRPLKNPSPPRGAVVLVRRDNEPERLFLKRVIGLPGERVRIEGPRLLIDNVPLEEPYVAPNAQLEPKRDQNFALAEDQYVVLGDARDDSLDSRTFGPIRSKEIEGIAVARFWPPWRISFRV